MNNKIEGFYYLTSKSGDVLNYHCSKCGVTYHVGDDGAPQGLWCCGKRVPLPDQTPKTSFFGLFSTEPEPLPRVRYNARPLRSLIQREDPLNAAGSS